MDNNFGWNLGGDFIAHYGTKRHSGRYPWGSGAKNGRIETSKKEILEEYEKYLDDPEKYKFVSHSGLDPDNIVRILNTPI